jgi:hypothetical protein
LSVNPTVFQFLLSFFSIQESGSEISTAKWRRRWEMTLAFDAYPCQLAISFSLNSVSSISRSNLFDFSIWLEFPLTGNAAVWGEAQMLSSKFLIPKAFSCVKPRRLNHYTFLYDTQFGQ